MCADDQIIISWMYNKIEHVDCGQSVAKRVPSLSPIKGSINSQVSTCIKDIFVPRVFRYNINRFQRQVPHDRLPCFAKIIRHIHISSKFVFTLSRQGGITSLQFMAGSYYSFDGLIRQSAAHVAPTHSIVQCNLNISPAHTDINQTNFKRRFRQRTYSTPLSRSQIRADTNPVISAVKRLEYFICPTIKGKRIMMRYYQGSVPGKSQTRLPFFRFRPDEFLIRSGTRPYRPIHGLAPHITILMFVIYYVGIGGIGQGYKTIPPAHLSRKTCRQGSATPSLIV